MRASKRFSDHVLDRVRRQARSPVTSPIRRTCDTLAVLTFSSRAVARTPRLSSSAARIRLILSRVVLGQSRCFAHRLGAI
jgi:hypothetical protein